MSSLQFPTTNVRLKNNPKRSSSRLALLQKYQQTENVNHWLFIWLVLVDINLLVCIHFCILSHSHKVLYSRIDTIANRQKMKLK